MVAIVSGSNAGLDLTSFTSLGGQGAGGVAAQGRNGERAYVNVASGNLVLQDVDDRLVGHGLAVTALRTYNSQGQYSDDNGDNWTAGIVGKQIVGNGPLNKSGSTVVRTEQDGGQQLFTFDAARGEYVNTDGGGAYDTVLFDKGGKRFIWTDGTSGATEEYESNGLRRLLSATDPSGNTLTYTYYGPGSGMPHLLARIDDASGETTWFDYGAFQQLQQVRTVTHDPATGAVQTQTRVHYAYDAIGRLATVSVDLSPQDNAVGDGRVYETGYTYVGRSTTVASISQTDGTRLAFTWVTAGGVERVASVTDGAGQVTSFSYDTVNRRTTVTDPLNLKTLYDYDAQGQLLKVTGPAVNGVSQVNAYAYNSRGDVIRTVDGEGHATDMQYDANGNQVLMRDSAGNTVQRTFDTRNQLLTETVYAVPDPDGAGPAQPGQAMTSRNVYDSGGRHLLRFVVSADGRVTEYRTSSTGERIASLRYSGAFYNLVGLDQNASPDEAQMQKWVASVNAAHVERADMRYDTRGQLQQLTTYAAVDALGRGIVDGSESTTRYVYDQAGQLLKTVSPNQGSTAVVYDGLGRLLSTVNALGEVTVSQYDDARNSTTVRLANGLATTSAYDRAGRLISVTQTDAAANSLGQTRYVYDADGRLLMTQDPTGVRHWMLYDAAGRKIADIDGNGNLVETQYNRDNQLTHRIAYATSVKPASLVNGQGLPSSPALADIRPVRTTQDRNAWYAYDAANRLVKAVDAGGAVIENRFDGASRLIGVTSYANRIDPRSIADQPGASAIAPISSEQDRISRNFYDNDNHLRATLDGEGFITVLDYDAAGQLTQKTAYATATQAALRATGTLAQLLPPAAAGDVHSFVVYNARGEVVGDIDGEGYLTETTRDADGNVVRSVRYATRVDMKPGATLASLRPAATMADQVRTWRFDALDRIVSQTDVWGVRTDTTWDLAGNIVATARAVNTDELRVGLTSYDLQGRITGQLSAEGAAQITAYPGNPRPGSNQSRAGVDAIWARYGTRFTVDAAGRRTSAIDPNGQRTLYFYDNDGNLTHTINALGEVEERQVDAFNQLTATIRYGTRLPPGGLATLAGGLATAALRSAIAALADPAQDSRATFTYDSTGTLATSTDALGNRSSFFHDAFGQESARQIAIDATHVRLTGETHDRRGLLTSLLDDAAQARLRSSTAFDAFGRAIRTIDANGNETLHAYDKLGREVQTVDPLGGVRLASYDAFDRVLRQTDATGNTTNYAYNDATRSIVVTSPEGIALRSVRNRHSQVQSLTDGNGNLTQYRYDRNGNLIGTDAALGRSSRRYDTANRLIETTDANGTRVAYRYDAADRMLTRTVDPDGLHLATSWEVDAKGQQIAATDANGVLTITRYDLAGRALRQTVDPAGLNLSTVYTLDAQGRVLTVTGPTGNVVQTVYDNLGRRIEEHTDPAGLNLVRRYAYDANGNLISSIDPDGHATLYAWDSNDRLVLQVDGAGGVTQTMRDAEGRVIRTTSYAKAIDLAGLGNVGDPFSLARPAPGARAAAIAARIVASPTQDAVEYRVLDHDGRLRFTVDGIGAVVEQQFDGNGNLVLRVGYAQGIAPAALATSTGSVDAMVNTMARLQDVSHDVQARFTYDAANRLTWSVNGVGAVSQRSYDPAGNLLRQVDYATPLAAAARSASISLSPSSSSSSPLVPPLVLPLVPASDADRITVMAYDAANRLVVQVDAAGGVVRQFYDGQGNTVQRIAYAHAIALPADTTLNGFTGTVGTVSTVSTVSTVGAIVPDPANDRVWRTAFDAAGRAVLAIDPEGAVTANSYDGAGHVVATVAYATPVDLAHVHPGMAVAEVQALIPPDPLHDRVQRTVLDAAGRPVIRVDALGYVVQNQYDGDGRVIATTRYAQAVAVTASDSLATAIAPSARDQTNRFAYDAAGNLLSSTDALGNTESSTWDALGQQRSFINKNGATWRYEHDAAGRRITEIAPQVGMTAVRLQATVGADPEITIDPAASGNFSLTMRLDYDVFGHVIARTEAVDRPEERTTRYEYDALGRQVKTLFPEVGVYNAAADDLAANGMHGFAARTEVAATLYSEVFYDVFGNAVANRDVAGNLSLKLYDRLGRVSFDIDAEGYATGYARNRFGDVTALTRTSTQTGLPQNDLLHNDLLQTMREGGPASAVANVATSLATTLATTLAAQDHRSDRVITTRYDRLGRAVEVDEPEAYTFNGAQGMRAGKITRFMHDAFGAVVQSSVLQDPVTQTWSNTFLYYDRLGRQSAMVDAMGYLTTDAHDAQGNLVAHTEYANATDVHDIGGFALPVASAEDRATLYTYDALNRKASETLHDVTFSSAGDGSAQRGDLVSHYAYDAVGNLVVTTDAAGGVTTSVYDALGRVVAVAAPMRADVDGKPGFAPVTVFGRDAYGNVVVKLDYAGPVEVAALRANPVAPVGGGDDRVVLTRFDRHGHALQIRDGNGNSTLLSYDAHGQLAKQWQTVTGNDGQSQTVFQAYLYDKTGRQTDVITPASDVRQGLGVRAMSLAARYDTQTMDDAGKIVGQGWSGSNRVVLNWSGLTDASATSGPVRIEIGYTAVTHSLPTPREVDKTGRVIAFNPSVATKTQQTRAQLYSAAEAAGGIVMTWELDANGVNEGVDLLQTITVSQQNAAGEWALLWQGAPAQATGDLATTVGQDEAGVNVTHAQYNAFGEMTGRGINGGQQESFDYDNAGHLWRTNSGDGVDKVVLFDVQGHGTAQIQGIATSLSQVDGPEAAAVMDGTRRTDLHLDALGRLVQQVMPERDGMRPVVNRVLDRWGNVLEISDPRSATIRTVYRYNVRNQVIDESLPDAPGNQSADALQLPQLPQIPHLQRFYDQLGRNVAVRDAMGNLNGMVYDAGSNLVEERHADGGVVRSAFNAFGERIVLRDALGNATGYHYDHAGQLLQIDRPDGSTIQNRYDQAGRTLALTNGAGDTLRYRYDAAGNLTTLVQPLGQAVWSLFDAQHRKSAEIDANGFSNQWAHDYFGQLVAHVDLAGVAYTYTYDGVTRQLLGQSNARGQSLSYSHDAAGQLTQVVDHALNQITRYAYDAAGNRTFESTVQDGVTYQANRIAYDAQNRIIDVQGQDDLHLHMDYDRNGNRLHERIRFTYPVAPGLGDIGDTGDASDTGNTSDTGLFGRALTEFEKQVYPHSGEAFSQDLWYAYDVMNRQTLVDGAVDGNADNLANLIDGQGHRISYNVNGNRKSDRHIGTQVSATALGTPGESGFAAPLYAYASQRGLVTETYGYDSNNRLTSVRGTAFDSQFQAQDASHDLLLDARQYDGADRLIASGPQGLSQGVEQQLVDAHATLGVTATRNSYDANGRLLQQTSLGLDDPGDGHGIVAADVDANGNPHEPLARFAVKSEATYDGYDGAGNLRTYHVTVPGEHGYTSTYTLTQARYDSYKDGAIDATRADNTGEPGNTTERYDVNGNLIGVTDATKAEYARTFINDARSNLLQETQIHRATATQSTSVVLQKPCWNPRAVRVTLGREPLVERWPSRIRTVLRAICRNPPSAFLTCQTDTPSRMGQIQCPRFSPYIRMYRISAIEPPLFSRAVGVHAPRPMVHRERQKRRSRYIPRPRTRR
jgi:YD repeat-containing protein